MSVPALTDTSVAAPAAPRLRRSAFTLLTSNIGSAALSFLLSVLVARLLGETGLGVYAAALAWVFPLRLLAEFGLGTLLTRDLAAQPESAATLLHAAVRTQVVLGIALTVLLWSAAPLLSQDAQVVQGLRLSAPLLLIEPFYGAFTALFRARQTMLPIAALNIGMLLAQVVLTAGVLLAGGGVLAALLVNVGTSAGQLAAAWGWYRAARAHGRFTAPTAEDPTPVLRAVLLRRALPFAVAGVLAALQLRVGVLLLENLRGTAETGYYAAASRLVEALRVLPNALFGVLLPALAGLLATPAALARLFRRTLLLLAGFGLLAGLLGLLLGHLLIEVVYGSAFLPAVPVLQLALWALLPGMLRAALSLHHYAYRREWWVNRVTAMTLLLQIAACLLFVPAHGAAGVALALLLTEPAACVLLAAPLQRGERAA